MKITLYVSHIQWGWQTTGYLEFNSSKGDDSEYRKNLTTIEVEVPDMQPLAAEEIVPHWVAMLEEQKSRINAEAHKQLAEIDDKIANMLALTSF